MIKRRFFSAFFVALLSIGIMLLPCTASAAENSRTQDGLVASIVSEKDNYSVDEDIDLTFNVTNTNNYSVETVSLEAIIPDGLKLKNPTEANENSVSLVFWESLGLTLIKLQ